jgi:hypothetical protein
MVADIITAIAIVIALKTLIPLQHGDTKCSLLLVRLFFCLAFFLRFGCWAGAIGTMPRLAVLGAVMRITIAGIRIPISARAGALDTGLESNSLAGSSGLV